MLTLLLLMLTLMLMLYSNQATVLLWKKNCSQKLAARKRALRQRHQVCLSPLPSRD